MTDLSHLLQQSSAHAWLFVPSAILLGALHGLEPGHSKTMMAAFIIAVRGTVLQAVLLGLSATISHTAIVWAIALAGLYFGQELSGERSEAYLQTASAVIIIGIAGWMVWRTWREQTHAHDHHHHDEPQSISLAGASLLLEVFEDGVPPRWRIRNETGALPAAGDIKVTTIREDGSAADLRVRCPRRIPRKRRRDSRAACVQGARRACRRRHRATVSRNMITTTWISAKRTMRMRAPMPTTFAGALRGAT